MSILTREGRKGCGRGAIIQLIAAAIVIPLFVIFILVPAWLYTQYDLSDWALIIPASIFVLILAVGGVIAVTVVLKRRSGQLDAAFAPLGLKGQAYQISFRKYSGEINGRQVRVYLYRGPALELDVSTSVHTRFGLSQRGSDTETAARLLNQKSFATTDPALSGLQVFSKDEAWTNDLLARPEARQLLNNLIESEDLFTTRQVLARPGWFRLFLYGSRNLIDFDLAIKPETARQWVEDMIHLARLAESLPPPQWRADETAAERIGQTIRNANPWVLPAITLAVLLFSMLCLTLFLLRVFNTI